jgi:hypothetical protein
MNKATKNASSDECDPRQNSHKANAASGLTTQKKM